LASTAYAARMRPSLATATCCIIYICRPRKPWRASAPTARTSLGRLHQQEVWMLQPWSRAGHADAYGW
jgi:hypothetical protein